MKKILKWFFGAVLLVVVLAVVLLLSLDTILRVIAENRIRAQTGMDAEIGKFHVGLLEPVVSTMLETTPEVVATAPPVVLVWPRWVSVAGGVSVTV